MDSSALLITCATPSPAPTVILQHLKYSHKTLFGSLARSADMLSLGKETVTCGIAVNQSAAGVSSGAITLYLRDRTDDTEALANCRTLSQGIVDLAEDRFAGPGEDMYSSTGFAEVQGQQDGNVGLRNDNTKINKLSNSTSDSRTSVPETEHSNSSPQSRRLPERSDGYRNSSFFDVPTGVGVVPVEAGRERIAGARPKRKPTTKRQRSTRVHHANSSQPTAAGTVNTTVSVPNLPSRPPPAVPAVAKQNAPSGKETQASGIRATSQSSDTLLVKKAALYTDLEPANIVLDIAVVPRSHSIEKRTSAGRHKAHSMPESPALGLLQPAVGNIKDACTPNPLRQRSKQGTRRRDKAKDSQDMNVAASREFSSANIEDVTGIDENVQNPNATYLAKTQTARAPDGKIKAGDTTISESLNDQANPVIGKTGSDFVWRRLRRKKQAHDVNEKKPDMNESEQDFLARSKHVYSLNTSPRHPSFSSIIYNINRNHPNQSLTTTTHSTDLSTQAKHIQHRGTMSTAGSTRGHGGSHRGRDSRRSSNNQVLPDDAVSVFQSQRTPSVGSTRRRRGFQPDEVNKDKEKSGPENPSTTQGGDNTKNLTAIDNHPKASATTNKLASPMTPRSTEALAPHRRTLVKDEDSNNQSFIHTQVARMDASRPELDPVYFGGVSNPIESETSSIQIITERQPSCWSIASPPEAPPTEWNSAAANIDRPAKTQLPIYRIPRQGHKTERETASSSFNRQQAKLKPQATGAMSKAQKPHEMNRSLRVAAPEKDEAQANTRAASRKDGHAADSLHQLQQLQHDERLDAEQASKLKAIQEEVLANTMQVSSETQLDNGELKSCSPTEDTSQAKLLDVKEFRTASSAVSSQAKINQVSIPPGKQSGAAPPHLRVQSARPGPDNKNKSLPPHLRGSASPSTTTATKAAAHDEDIEPGKHTISAMQDTKFPPHLQGLSAAKTRATKGLFSVTTPSPTSQKKDDSYRPTIDMDEEIATTQSVLDIDEEIVAGLRAETSGAFPVAQPTDGNAQEPNEQVIYVPPHSRASSSRVKVSVAESKSEVTNKDAKVQPDLHADPNHSTNIISNGFAVGLYAGALQDVTSKRKNANLASPSGVVPNGAGSSVKRGKKPVREFEPVDYTSELVDWDGKMNPPPVGDEWDRRRPFNPRSHERLSVIEAWRKEHAADPEENNRVIVNTASTDFQTGEGLAGGDADVLSPINKMDHETHTSNDDFTQARRHQNAAEAIKDYEAKIAAKPISESSGIEGMTKKEKRALRRALIDEERTRVIPPNPHAPAANIYLRPAEFKDMGQVMNIYNHYVRETSLVLHLDPVDELYWRSRLQEAEDERNPFVVAIHMGEKSCRHQGDIIRKKQENIVGFTVAADFGSKHTMYHSSVELELMVHPEFFCQGIGRTLLDRILAALSPDHNLLECAPFLPHNNISHWIGGGSRQAKAIMINILYSDGKEDTVTWRKQWLAKYEFQHAGTLPHVGFKKGKLSVMPRCFSEDESSLTFDD